jgi:hypothetical protein
VIDTNMARWEAMRDYVRDTPGQYVVSDNDPTPIGIPNTAAKWARRVSASWYVNTQPTVIAEAEDLAAKVNSFTDLGFNVVVDEVRFQPIDTTPVVALACGLFTAPRQVHLYLVSGARTSYEALDMVEESGVITSALNMGVGILPEMYVNQYVAEASGNIVHYIDSWLHGPSDQRMPYLIEQWRLSGLDELSQVHFVIAVGDKFFQHPVSPSRKPNLPSHKFLDILMQRMAINYPNVFFGPGGPSTWRWASDSGGVSNPRSGISDSARAPNVVELLKHYTVGRGAESGGRVRYFRG